MKVITLQGNNGVFDSEAKTLDAAWVQAEALGKAGIETKFNGEYRATIQFNTRSGSTVFSHGEGRTPLDALLSAIEEATSLGAGRGA